MMMDGKLHTQAKTASAPSFTPVFGSAPQHKCACVGSTTSLAGGCSECSSKKLSAARDPRNQEREQTRTLSRHESQPQGKRSSNSTALHPQRSRHDFSRIDLYAASQQSTRAHATTSTLFLTDEGTETINGGGGGGGGPALNYCGVTGAFTSIPNSQSLVAALAGNKLTRHFVMKADFSATNIPCNCSCGEYRQYVRGEFKNNGTTVAHPLCGTNLDPTIFQEDCGRIGGTDYKYGYRSIPFATSSFSNPDQAGGCTFNGEDAPGIIGASGDKLEMMLDFKAELVDTCNNTTLANADWSVGGSATVP
jgi:hypothetical protein